LRNYGSDQDDLCNVIEDQRHLRARTPSPPRRSLARDDFVSGRLDKFKARHIDSYDGSSNSEEFIQIYQTVIEAAGGDGRVKANYLPMALAGAARSWLINLPEGSIYTLDQLCVMFIKNFQGTYKHPSTAQTLKTIKQKHDESLRDYVKCFCDARNTIPYI
jgi:hypothetical protein